MLHDNLPSTNYFFYKNLFSANGIFVCFVFTDFLFDVYNSLYDFLLPHPYISSKKGCHCSR